MHKVLGYIICALHCKASLLDCLFWVSHTHRIFFPITRDSSHGFVYRKPPTSITIVNKVRNDKYLINGISGCNVNLYGQNYQNCILFTILVGRFIYANSFPIYHHSIDALELDFLLWKFDMQMTYEMSSRKEALISHFSYDCKQFYQVWQWGDVDMCKIPLSCIRRKFVDINEFNRFVVLKLFW